MESGGDSTAANRSEDSGQNQGTAATAGDPNITAQATALEAGTENQGTNLNGAEAETGDLEAADGPVDTAGVITHNAEEGSLEEADYVYSNIFTFENSPPFKALYNQIDKLPEAKLDKYKKSLERIFNFVNETIKNERNLNKTSKNLSYRLQQANTELEKQTSLNYQENSRIGDLKRELLKTQNEVALCMEKEGKYMDELRQNENQKISLIADIEQIRQHKVDMLEPQLVATNKELRMDILQRKQQIENLRKDYDEKREAYLEILKQKEKLDIEREKFNSTLTKASEFPPKMMKQNEVLREGIQSLQAESIKQNNMGTQLDTEIVKVTKRKLELEKDRAELQGQCESRMLQIEAMEAQTDEIFKNHELAKEQLTIQKQEIIRLDSALKKSTQDIQREHDLLLRCFREKENASKLYVRLESLVRNIKNMMPKIQKQKDELERELIYNQQECKHSKNKIRNARQDIDLIIYQYLQQEILDSSQKDALQAINNRIAQLENQLVLVQSESHATGQRLYSVNIERELRARDLTRIMQKYKNIKEDIRMKSSIVKDSHKRHAEVKNQLRFYVSLYDSVKAERNKYLNLIQASLQKASEIREKIKILGNEIDILRNEYTSKEKELHKRTHDKSALIAVRDAYRHDVNKFSLSYREKRDLIEQKMSLLESFCHVINSSESKLQLLKKDYDHSIKSRNSMTMKLLERQEELCILYEKINTQEGVLKRGEFNLRQRDEEQRIAKLAIQELERECKLLRKRSPIQTSQVEEIKELRSQLDTSKRRVSSLSHQLESPQNENRSRHLAEFEYSEEELARKLRRLEEKIAEKEEVLLERDLVLEDITKLTMRLSEQTKSNQKNAIETNQKINKLQGRLKEINNGMMALVAELSLAQAQAMQYQTFKAEKEQLLEEAKERFSRNMVPLPEFEYEYLTMEKQKMHRHEQFMQRNRDLEIDEDDENFHLVNGIRTTADARPNAYLVPNDLPIPRPYGAYAPFKPNEPGSNMRHFSKPALKPIEL